MQETVRAVPLCSPGGTSLQGAGQQPSWAGLGACEVGQGALRLAQRVSLSVSSQLL